MAKSITNGNDPVGSIPTEMNAGLTKRELFAAMAMQGYISAGGVAYGEISDHSVAQSDALIEALNK